MRILVTINNQPTLFEVYRVLDLCNNTLLFNVNKYDCNFYIHDVYNAVGVLNKLGQTGFIDLSHNFCRVQDTPTQFVDNTGIERELEFQDQEEIDINDDDWIRSL